MTTVAPAAVAIVDLLENTDQAVRIGTTVVRMILRLSVAALTLGTDIGFNHAVAVITRDAFLAGATPEPATDRLNWYLWDGSFWATDTDAGPRTRTFDYDIRSKRKIADLDRILLHVIENPSSSSIRYNIVSNVLLQLP